MKLAGRGGFEPPRRYKRLPDFESGTFNHSATFPGGPRRTGGVHHTVPAARGQAARRRAPASAPAPRGDEPRLLRAARGDCLIRARPR